MSYVELQDQLDPVTAPGHWMERGYMLAEQSDAFIRAAVDVYRKVPDGATKTALLIMPFGGAIADISGDATCFGSRRIRYWVVILANFEPWARQATMEFLQEADRQLKPFSVGRYANTIEDALDTSLIYSKSIMTRLEQLKSIWDPSNVFRYNHNIQPSVSSRPP